MKRIGENTVDQVIEKLRVNDPKEVQIVLQEALSSVKSLEASLNQRIEQLRQSFSERTRAAAEVQLTPEQRELIQNLIGQYDSMQAALTRYYTSLEGMPSKQLVSQLLPECIDEVMLIDQPKLLLVPPDCSQTIISAIDKDPPHKKGYMPIHKPITDYNCFNGGNPKPTDHWRMIVADGTQNRNETDSLYRSRKMQECKPYDSDAEMSKILYQHQSRGLDVISDLDVYLALLIKSFIEGKIIDNNHCSTILNAKNWLEHTYHVQYGFYMPICNVGWDHGLSIRHYLPEIHYSMSVRAMFEFELPHTSI
jgi:hypothetical protein